MASDYIEIVDVSLTAGSVGRKALSDVVGIDVQLTHPSKIVKTMNRRRRGRGFQNGTPEYSADLTVADQLDPEIDWMTLQRTKEQFLLSYREVSGLSKGRAFQLVTCQVDDISTSYEEEGETRRRVRVMALDHREVPT